MRKLTHALAAALVIMVFAGGAFLGSQQNAKTEKNGLDARPFSAGVVGASSARNRQQLNSKRRREQCRTLACRKSVTPT